jgi:hypothetical protein
MCVGWSRSDCRPDAVIRRLLKRNTVADGSRISNRRKVFCAFERGLERESFSLSLVGKMDDTIMLALFVASITNKYAVTLQDLSACMSLKTDCC